MVWMKQEYTLLVIMLLVSGYAYAAANPFQSVIRGLIKKLRANPDDPALFWNYVCIKTVAVDYTPSLVKTPDQDGPTRTSRAYAIIHGAMYDAYNYVYQPSRMLNFFPNIEFVVPDSRESVAMVAISQAAYRCLLALYPKQRVIYNELIKVYMKILEARANTEVEVRNGIRVGDLVATKILKDRSNDRSNAARNHTLPIGPGCHCADPTRPKQTMHCPHWGDVRPFVLQSGSQFRSPNIVGRTMQEKFTYINSNRFIRDYIEVVFIGARDSKWRSPDQTEVANFWAYDGAPKIGVPPRLYNQVARAIAILQGNNMTQNVKLFALANYAMADVAIASWDTKYYYDFWRPIVAIRTGTSLLPPIRDWLPLGAPSDGVGENFTPGFPSFNSGHSAFGSALFQVLRRFYNTDSMTFTLKSDEYNGKTIDTITKKPRPIRLRNYETLTQAETENELARIYLGIHWRADQSDGRIMGRKVGDYVCDELL